MEQFEEHLEKNPNWNNLTNPDVGDIVHLKLIDHFVYRVFVIVSDIKKHRITGTIKGLHDWKTEGLGGLPSGNIMGHKIIDGKFEEKIEVCFNIVFMQNVIKKWG